MIQYVPMCDYIKHGTLFTELFDTDVTPLKNTFLRSMQFGDQHSNDSADSSFCFIFRFKILLVCFRKHVILFYVRTIRVGRNKNRSVTE